MSSTNQNIAMPAAAPRSWSLFRIPSPPAHTRSSSASRCSSMWRRGGKAHNGCVVSLAPPSFAAPDVVHHRLLIWSARGAPRDLKRCPTPQSRATTALYRAEMHPPRSNTRLGRWTESVYQPNSRVPHTLLCSRTCGRAAACLLPLCGAPLGLPVGMHHPASPPSSSTLLGAA